jgi:hypothetical protein
MDIAAATVSFVGLSGQLLQGCNYLCDFFSDVTDAPEVIVATSAELCSIRLQLEAFRRLLLEIQTSCPISFTVHQDPAVPLQNCQDAIQKLQKFIDRFSDLPTKIVSNQGNSQTGRAAARKAWQKFDFARNGNKPRRHSSRLEAVKTSLIETQGNVQLALQLQHGNMTREIQRCLQQLRDEHTTTAQIVEETRIRATNTHTLLEDHTLHTKRANISLDQVSADTQVLLARSASAERCSDVTQDAIASLSTHISDSFDSLPTILVRTIETTIAKSLAEHNASSETGVALTGHVPSRMSTTLQSTGIRHDDISSSPLQTRSEMPVLVSGRALPITPANLSGMPMTSAFPASDIIQSVQLSRRGPKRQKTKKSTFNVWFGRIEFISSITDQEDDVDAEYILPKCLQARRTTFKLIPNLWFLKTGLLFGSGDSRPQISQPSWDNRLRVIRTHQRDSAIYNAVEGADYIHFRRLLERREVTPFDLVDYGDKLRTLFEVVVSQFVFAPKDGFHRDHADSKSLLEIARLLAGSGVDCGAGRVLYLVLHAIYFNENENENDILLSLWRIIMASSQSDPFEPLRGDPVLRRNSILKSLPLISSQDAWDLSELKSSFEDLYGEGSFPFIVEYRGDLSDWREGVQKPKWHQTLAPFRRSKSLCLAEFGSSFMDYHWPELCWLHERPAFWQSKQACEEAFGGYFVEFKWPELYWKVELPNLWHSEEACLEMFGSLFVTRSWRDYLGEMCFEFLKGKGAWEKSRNWWDDIERNEWISGMANCWLNDDITLKYTRQHCIDQYGTHFTQDQLPSLLREEGLSEEDVLRLTEYGPDMDPPLPRPYWLREVDFNAECDGSGYEESGEDYTEPDNESHSESNDGWETAEED